MKRIIALIAVFVVLATAFIVPASAIEIGVCTNVNFFDIDSLTLTENEYDTETGYFSYYPYYEDGVLAVTFGFDENYIQSHDQLFIRLGGKGVKNLSANVNYSMRYSYYFDMHQELSVSLGIVENSEDVIFWEFSPYGTSLDESGFDSVMNDDNTFAIIIETNDLEWIDDGVNIDTVYLRNIQVNEMCISDSCEYCADGNPKPYMSYSEEIFTVVGAMRQEIEQVYDEGVTDGYNEGYTDGESDGLTDGYNHGYSEGETAGLTTGYNNGYTEGETAGFTTGYNNGYSAGETAGLATGYNNGYTEGKTEGFNNGYSAGEQSTVSKDIVSIIGEIAMAPYTAISSMFDFEIFGLNVAGLIFQFITTVVFLLVVGLIFKYLF